MLVLSSLNPVQSQCICQYEFGNCANCVWDWEPCNKLFTLLIVEIWLEIEIIITELMELL